MQFTTKMMLNLLNDLLDLAQIQKNTFSLYKQYTNIFDTIQKAFDIIKPQADLKNVQLELKRPSRR